MQVPERAWDTVYTLSAKPERVAAEQPGEVCADAQAGFPRAASITLTFLILMPT